MPTVGHEPLVSRLCGTLRADRCFLRIRRSHECVGFVTEAAEVRTLMGSALTPEGILQLGMAFWSSKALLSAVELGLFTELAKAPADANTLVQRLGLHTRSARDFLDALVALKMLERDDGIYRNTPATDSSLIGQRRAMSAAFSKWRMHAFMDSGAH